MLLKTSYQRELDKFCKTLMTGQFNIREVTKSALTQARAKLHPWAFIRLNEVAVNTFYEEAEYLEWKDLRVLAVDGSTLKLPRSKSIIEEFGQNKTGRHKEAEVCLARCSLLYDVLNHVTIDAQIGPYKESEKSLFLKHFGQIKKGDLILGDRNYPSTEMMLRLAKKGFITVFGSKRMRAKWLVRSFFLEQRSKLHLSHYQKKHQALQKDQSLPKL